MHDKSCEKLSVFKRKALEKDQILRVVLPIMKQRFMIGFFKDMNYFVSVCKQKALEKTKNCE